MAYGLPADREQAEADAAAVEPHCESLHVIAERYAEGRRRGLTANEIAAEIAAKRRADATRARRNGDEDDEARPERARAGQAKDRP